MVIIYPPPHTHSPPINWWLKCILCTSVALHILHGAGFPVQMEKGQIYMYFFCNEFRLSSLPVVCLRFEHSPDDGQLGTNTILSRMVDGSWLGDELALQRSWVAHAATKRMEKQTILLLPDQQANLIVSARSERSDAPGRPAFKKAYSHDLFWAFL